MISSCKDENELEELLFTIQDIYGPVPEELNNLLIISLMKQKLSDKNIQRLKIYNDSVTIQLNKESVLKFSLESDDLRTNCDEIIERVNNSN
jgi:Transcription-repair coupling factor (superfamily II helicase)